jgi:hypothetical protein
MAEVDPGHRREGLRGVTTRYQTFRIRTLERIPGRLHRRRRVAITEAGDAPTAGAIAVAEDARIRIRHMPPVPE